MKNTLAWWDWRHSVEAFFTDVLGQRWHIDRDGNRHQLRTT
jgi:hypothetical protein